MSALGGHLERFDEKEGRFKYIPRSREDSTMSRTVCIDQYTLEVEITSCTRGRPGKYTGPWEDCYPDEPPELEFEVIGGLVEDADGNETDLGRNGCAAVAEQYAETIEQKLWDQLEDERGGAWEAA